ncbi:DNA topoisomerase 3-beta [Linum grandiflorum]
MAPPGVLMVAEKPSIASSIASVLSHGKMFTRKGSSDVHEFDAMFLGFPAHYKVTSVIGHVFSVDFPEKYQNWSATDPLDLFQAPVRKSESNPKAHIRRHLSQEARGCTHLVLWLDCDREGENICFEVIECTGFQINDGRRKIHRARFSSVTEKDISKAIDNLVEPNKDEALAVDARQEIDLKVGVAFTRF